MYPLSMATFGEDWNKSQFWVRPFFFVTVSCYLPRLENISARGSSVCMCVRIARVFADACVSPTVL